MVSIPLRVESIPQKRSQQQVVQNNSLPLTSAITALKDLASTPMEHHQGDPVISRQFFQETPRKQAAIRVGWVAAGVLISALALLVPRPVFSQASAGITGTITDPSGAVVANAPITVTNEATTVAEKTTS